MTAERLAVSVNGELRELPRGSTVGDLIAAAGLQPERVAVERNRQLVRRADHAATVLEDGDRIEIVTFLGGG